MKFAIAMGVMLILAGCEGMDFNSDALCAQEGGIAWHCPQGIGATRSLMADASDARATWATMRRPDTGN